MKSIIHLIAVILLLAGLGCTSQQPNVKLWEWERGIAVESRRQEGMVMYLWFYEWNMFDAVNQGQHTPGGFLQFKKEVSKDQNLATMTSDSMRLTMRAVKDGVELSLSITNRSEHDWPELAGIIPCFNPGPESKPNPQFTNTDTYFLSSVGLKREQKREIHFNEELHPLLAEVSKEGEYVFSEKWPTSEVNASAGIIIRQSADRNWVTGIAWDDFLSSQAHNPWKCMHLCIRVGPLKRLATRTIRGKIYLFQGDKEDCLKRYRKDFP